MSSGPSDAVIKARVHKAQTEKKYLNVSSPSMTSIKLAGAERYWSKPGNAGLVYLAGYHLVGNPMDLRVYLRKVFPNELGAATDAQLDAVIAAYGITRNDYNSTKKAFYDRAVAEQREYDRLNKKAPKNVAVRQAEVANSLASLDSFMVAEKASRGKKMPKPKAAKGAKVSKKRGGATLKERVDEAVRNDKVVNVDKLPDNMTADMKIAKAKMPLITISDKSRKRMVPGLAIASDNAAKYAAAVRLLDLPNGEQFIQAFNNLDRVAPVLSPALQQAMSNLSVQGPIGTASPLAGLRAAPSLAAPVMSMPTSVQAPTFTVPTFPSASPTLPAPTLSSSGLPMGGLPTASPTLPAPPLPMGGLPTASPTLPAPTLPAPSMSPTRSPTRVLPAPTRSPTKVVSSSPQLSPSRAVLPALSSPGRAGTF